MPANSLLQKVKIHLSKQFHLADEQIESMLPGFIATLHSHMLNLENALALDNPATIGKAAHTLKGALLNLGIEECARSALLIEEKAKAEDDSADFIRLVADLRAGLAPYIG